MLNLNSKMPFDHRLWGNMEDPFIIDVMSQNYYLGCRKLEDGTYIAIGPLITTVAIFTHLTPTGYSHRFCYTDAALAIGSYQEMASSDDIPHGWIARR